VLRKNFASGDGLIINFLWQTLEQIRNQQNRNYGSSQRELFQKTLLPILQRAELVGGEMSEEAAQVLYNRILSRMVEDELCSYGDLGLSS
jgi:hypothetical protein